MKSRLFWEGPIVPGLYGLQICLGKRGIHCRMCWRRGRFGFLGGERGLFGGRFVGSLFIVSASTNVYPGAFSLPSQRKNLIYHQSLKEELNQEMSSSWNS